MSKFKIAIVSFIIGAMACGFTVYKLTPKPKTIVIEKDALPEIRTVIRTPTDYAGYIAAFNAPIDITRWMEGDLFHAKASDTYKSTETVDRIIYPKYFPAYLVQGEFIIGYFNNKVSTMYGINASNFFYDGRFIIGGGVIYGRDCYGLKANAGIAIY